MQTDRLKLWHHPAAQGEERERVYALAKPLVGGQCPIRAFVVRDVVENRADIVLRGSSQTTLKPLRTPQAGQVPAHTLIDGRIG